MKLDEAEMLEKLMSLDKAGLVRLKDMVHAERKRRIKSDIDMNGLPAMRLSFEPDLEPDVWESIGDMRRSCGTDLLDAKIIVETAFQKLGFKVD